MSNITLNLFAAALALVCAALVVLAALLAPAVASLLYTTPVGPILCAIALLGEAQRREPAYAVMLVSSDRDFLAGLLAREV